MSYAGSFNGFVFGTGVRPGAAVSGLSGWKRNRATIDVLDGNVRSSTTTPRQAAGDVNLSLTLIATSDTALDQLVESALAAFVPTVDPLPLVVNGQAKWVQVTRAEPAQDPTWAGEECSTTMDVDFVAPEDVRYDASQTTAQTISVATTSSTFEAPNSGREVPYALRAWDFRMVAGSTLVDPRIRVDHADGTFEQVTFSGLTMTAGQVLTVQEDLRARVGQQGVSGRVRSLTDLGIGGRAPRWWRLLPSDGTDGANEVTMTATSGTFTGHCKVRSPR